jgi:alpha-L-fucosidase 2
MRGMRLTPPLTALLVASLIASPVAVPLPRAAGGVSRLPGAELNLRLDAPITTWDEAIPLGNGLLGGLLWGEGRTLRLSLDRGDLWDERPADGFDWSKVTYRMGREAIASGRNDEFNTLFDKPYDDVHPTKIPAGRIEITLPDGFDAKTFELSLADAQAHVRNASGTSSDGFFSATERVALVRIPTAERVGIAVHPPASLSKLGYPGAVIQGKVWFGTARGAAPDRDRAETEATWFEQEAAGGLRYCVYAAWRRQAGATLVAVTVTSTRDGGPPAAIADRLTSGALDRGYEASLEPHAAWWNTFWSASRVSVPQRSALQHYYLAQYFYGAASRRGAPPMPLQGVWTADAGGLPPWKGDYHNDLNTQMTYLAYQAAGRFDEGAAFLDLLWDLLPRFRRFAREFYGTLGAAVPGVMTLAGQPLGGWGQYSLSPTMGAWCAHLFYLHWRYTMDPVFLKERAYPFSREVGTFVMSLLRPNASGVLLLPLSTSPEIHDNGAKAWLAPNSNFDIACARMLFLALSEMARASGMAADAKRWLDAAERLGPLHVTPGGVLKLDARVELAESHRHLSNLMSVHPFNLVTIDGSEQDRRTIAASLRQWDALGTRGWAGYSFSWMACLRARVGDAESAWKNLDIYLRAFILRNGFHANGDQTKSGYSSMTYRPFTLEGNFLAAQAVHEMLLQSWSATPGRGDTEVIRIFPAVPKAWADVSFDDLRAEGGHRVSARREKGTTVWVRVTAGHDGLVRIRDTFGGRRVKWTLVGPASSRSITVTKVGNTHDVTLTRGDTIEGSV